MSTRVPLGVVRCSGTRCAPRVTKHEMGRWVNRLLVKMLGRGRWLDKNEIRKFSIMPVLFGKK